MLLTTSLYQRPNDPWRNMHSLHEQDVPDAVSKPPPCTTSGVPGSWGQQRSTSAACRGNTVACGCVGAGQLAGSLLATLYATLLQRHSVHRGGNPSHLREVALQAAPMLLAAALLEAAGRIAGSPRKRPRGPPDIAPFASPQVFTSPIQTPSIVHHASAPCSKQAVRGEHPKFKILRNKSDDWFHHLSPLSSSAFARALCPLSCTL